MEKILQKNNFLKAPGGNLYEWKDAETKFNVPKKGKYILKIIASAKNAQQNNSKDDDDGQIILGNNEQGLNINFENADLHFSLHGIKKIDYAILKKDKGKYDLYFTLYDIYDFDGKTYDLNDPVSIGVYLADELENNGMLKNFEIEIKISDSMILNS